MPLELIAIVVIDGNAHQTGSWLAQWWHLDGRVLIVDEDSLGNKGILAPHYRSDTFHQSLPELVDGCRGQLGLQLEELLGSIALNGGEMPLDRGQEFRVPIVGCDTGFGAGETEGAAWDEIVFIDCGTWVFHDLVSHLETWDRVCDRLSGIQGAPRIDTAMEVMSIWTVDVTMDRRVELRLRGLKRGFEGYR